jgi:hypothetical protein
MTTSANTITCEPTIMVVMIGLTSASKKNLEQKGNNLYISDNEPLEKLDYIGKHRLVVEVAAKLFDAEITALKISKANLVFTLMEVQADTIFTFELPMLPATEKIFRQLVMTSAFHIKFDDDLEYLKPMAKLETPDLEQAVSDIYSRRMISSEIVLEEIVDHAERLGEMLWEYESRLHSKASAYFRNISNELT